MARQQRARKQGLIQTHFLSACFLVFIGLLCLPVFSFATNAVDRYVVNASSNSVTASNAHNLYVVVGEPVIGQIQNSTTAVVMGFVAQDPNPGYTPTSTGTPGPTATATPSPTGTPIVTVVPGTFFKIYHSQINPMHGEQARLRWAQPQDGPVTIRIFNLLGDIVITLVNHGTYSAGQYNEVSWNGKTSRGAMAGSGIYIVLLEAPGYTTKAKAAVIK